MRLTHTAARRGLRTYEVPSLDIFQGVGERDLLDADRVEDRDDRVGYDEDQDHLRDACRADIYVN